MIDLGQYEVWFVAGSQHLYGDEALLVIDSATTTRGFKRELRSSEAYFRGGGAR